MNSSSTDPFVPLTAAAPASDSRTEFQVLLISQPDKAQPLKPLTLPSQSSAPAAANPACQPKVTLQRDGKNVTAIRIDCSCGQAIHLDVEHSA